MKNIMENVGSKLKINRMYIAACLNESEANPQGLTSEQRIFLSANLTEILK